MKKQLKLENLIYLAIFLLPLYLVREKIWIFPTNAFEILVFLNFFIWLIISWKKNILMEFWNEYRKFIISTSFILIGLTLSTFFNEDILRSLGIVKSYFLVPIALMLIAAATIEKERMANVFRVYYYSTLGVSLVSLMYIFLGELTYDGRLAAIFNSPNYLAMYLAPGVIFASILAGNSAYKQKNILSVYFLPIILIPLYFTYSYAAWAAIFFSVVAIFIFQRKINFKKALVILAILAVLIFSQIQNNKLNNLIELNDRSSMASRIMIWQASGKIMKDNFILGIGPGNFQKTYLTYQKYFPPYLEWAVPHPHNLFLAFWLSGGLVALVGFLSLLIFWFKDVFSRSEKNIFVISAIGIMLFILMHGLVDTTYFKNDLAVVFWLNLLALKK